MTTTQQASATLAQLAAAYWDKRVEADPVEATLLGERRFDDRMPNPSPAFNQAEIARLRALAGEVSAVPTEGLSSGDRVTHAALLDEIGNEVAARECAL